MYMFLDHLIVYSSKLVDAIHSPFLTLYREQQLLSSYSNTTVKSHKKKTENTWQNI